MKRIHIKYYSLILTWRFVCHDPGYVMVVVQELARCHRCLRFIGGDADFLLGCHDYFTVYWTQVRVLVQASCPVSPHGLREDGVIGCAPWEQEAAVSASLLPSLYAGRRCVQQDVLELGAVIHVHVEAPVCLRGETNKQQFEKRSIKDSKKEMAGSKMLMYVKQMNLNKPLKKPKCCLYDLHFFSFSMWIKSFAIHLHLSLIALQSQLWQHSTLQAQV